MKNWLHEAKLSLVFAVSLFAGACGDAESSPYELMGTPGGACVPPCDTNPSDPGASGGNSSSGTSTGGTSTGGTSGGGSSTGGTATTGGSSSSTTGGSSSLPTGDPIPQSGRYNYGEVLQKSLFFYDCQRSGKLPAGFRVSWRGDSALRDGSDVGVDLTGGFYDAGDHVKFGLPGAFAFTLLAWSGVEYYDAYVRTGQLSYYLDILRWAADYYVRAHVSTNEFFAQVGDEYKDHYWWGPPEKMTMERPSQKVTTSKPGSEVAAETAAFLAAASMVFKSTDASYSQKLLSHSRQLFDFADRYRGKYSDSISVDAYKSWNGYDDELAWGAAWLHYATAEQGYLDKAKTYKLGLWTNFDWDNKSHGAAVVLAITSNEGRYKLEVENWLKKWMPGGEVPRTPKGLAWGGDWGVLRLASNTAFLAAVYHDRINPKPEYLEFVVQQMNYILGNNERNGSYVVGFGQNPPVRAHHRAASGMDTFNQAQSSTPNKYVIYGALVGGPDKSGNWVDNRMDAKTNEVALDYNAGYQGAMARMYLQYGGTPLSSFP
jgi:endoglucanase